MNLSWIEKSSGSMQRMILLRLELKGMRNMRKNKISIEEHNDNFMLMFAGMLMGASVCAIAHLFVSLIK